MNKPDTKQASEDELTQAIYEAMQRSYLSERYDAIRTLIRTERLKLLADVRERVIGKDDPGITNIMIAAEHAKQRNLLTKLEAEL